MITFDSLRLLARTGGIWRSDGSTAPRVRWISTALQLKISNAFRSAERRAVRLGGDAVGVAEFRFIANQSGGYCGTEWQGDHRRQQIAADC